ncbi:MAG TPA: adenylate/guanylate cyclase domain-containing protein [Chitinophagaceae bacterium]|nr:adenylate/guanylate cyclase domain-containing protein [Chitinophagaceae bacterium]
MPQGRQLAAIMFTDIVGYTAMMQADEQKAVAVIKHYNATLEKFVTQHDGQVLNYYGDGSLCIFHNATDAANCSLAVQEELKKEPVVPLRIGLHIGEVFFEDAKALGDGVNVASRVQSLGQANTILVSAEFYDKIRNNSSFTSVSLGNFNFKNVGQPLQVFALTNTGLFVPQRKSIEGKLDLGKKAKKNIVVPLLIVVLIAAGFLTYKNFIARKSVAKSKDKSIAVLPFTDMSPAKDQEYFSDGLSEELIGALAKIPDLKVAGRTSSFSYKGMNKDLKAIGDELKVSSILEGSLRKSGNQLRITVQLINTDDGFNIWSDTYEVELTEIFGVQDKITKAIITALNVHLLNNKEPEAAATTSPDAYSNYLKARQQLSFRGEHLLEARHLFEETIKLDSNFSPAHSGLARTLSIFGNYLEIDNAKPIMDSAKQEANKALALNINNGEAWSVLGTIAAYYDWDWDAAEKAFTRSLAIGPNDAETYNFIGDYYQIVFNKKLAIEMESKAVELDPLLAVNYANLAMAYYMAKDYENAIRISNTGISMNLQSFISTANWPPLVWSYLETNQVDKAEEIVKKIPENDPLYMDLSTDIAIAKGENDLALGYLQKMKDHLHLRFAENYLQLKMWEKAAYEIEKAYAARKVVLVYYSRITLPEDYADHPALKKAFDKPELKKLFELRRKNMGVQKK